MRNITVGILSMLILISIFPIFNIKAQGVSKTEVGSIKETLIFTGEDDSSAKMIYEKSGESLEYILIGHNLIPNTSYTLVYYPEDVNNILCIGDGVSNMKGQMSIKNSVDIPSIPYITDPNTYLETTTVEGSTGAKVWLIQSHLINCYDHIFELSNLSKVLYPNNLMYYIEI